jgi:ribosomal-protein-alanine N-acetyltransferase
MSKELKPCPFCGGELQSYPSHVEGQYIVNKPGGVCKKCGMIFEGTHRQGSRNNTGLCDVNYYSVLREEWKKDKE